MLRIAARRLEVATMEAEIIKKPLYKQTRLYENSF